MKVAIYWYGAEGQASYRYYKDKGDDVTIITPKESPDFPIPVDAERYVGDDAADHLKEYDLVIRSASTRPDSLHTNGKVWSATNEFFQECKAPIIGVTGTKGKGTTSSWIASILRAGGKSAHLVGNIGVPPLEKLQEITPDDIVVFELSSFQLWDLEKSPHIAVVLMVEPDHLNVHMNMDEYIMAKSRIVAHQTAVDSCYYHPTNSYTQQVVGVGSGGSGESAKYRYASPESVYVRDNWFMVGDEKICPVSAVKLPGGFNIENACAAVAAARHYVTDPDAIAQGLTAFMGLPHRLKYVAEKNGVRFFDDSIATTPGSAMAALSSFEDDKVIIIGGATKGASYGQLLEAIKIAGAKVVAVGETGKDFHEECQSAGVESMYVPGLMDQVVHAAADMAKGRGVVLLSPAATSFDQYKSYTDRGNQFIAAVEAL